MVDLTPLQALRLRLALPVGENAVFDGWTEVAVNSAARQLAIDPAQARLAFPKDPPHMIEAWIDTSALSRQPTNAEAEAATSADAARARDAT